MGEATGGLIGLLLVVVIGLVIGVIAKVLMPGPDPGNWFVTILLGIAGSWAGGFLLLLTRLAGAVPGLIASVIGAMVLLGIYRLLKKSRGRPHCRATPSRTRHLMVCCRSAARGALHAASGVSRRPAPLSPGGRRQAR
jgi:uncharacterized membrane protein YeaQ/YmgE (transglycosylase-associated protein family)